MRLSDDKYTSMMAHFWRKRTIFITSALCNCGAHCWICFLVLIDRRLFTASCTVHNLCDTAHFQKNALRQRAYLVFAATVHSSWLLLFLEGARRRVGRGVTIGGVGGTGHLSLLRCYWPVRWSQRIGDWGSNQATGHLNSRSNSFSRSAVAVPTESLIEEGHSHSTTLKWTIYSNNLLSDKNDMCVNHPIDRNVWCYRPMVVVLL